MSGIFKNLKNTPTTSKYKYHYICDYIEILALANNDLLSKSDIINRLYYSDPNQDELEIEDDKHDSYILELFAILEVRSNTFKDFYPFEITTETISSIKLKTQLSDAHKKYIFLLLSSSLSYISQNKVVEKNNTLENDFETFSFETLKSYIFENINIHQFGQALYSGTLQEKVDKLANDLKFRTTYKKHYFDSHNRGDGGIDLVAWKQFPNDTNNLNIALYLGQCATGKDWIKKQDDIDKFENYINFESYITKLFFIPYDGRDRRREFLEEKDINISKNILFDRVRLLNTIDINYDISKLDSYRLIQSAIAYKEGIL
jgi:hypothetical protein